MSKRKRRKKEPLTEQQKEAARLFFEAYKPGQIAGMVGVHRCTVWRWAQRPDFRREIDRITNNWLRAKRRETLREIRSSPEYRQRQKRKYAARRRLKKLSERLNNASSGKEYQLLYKQFETAYNEAYFDGKTPSEYINSCRISNNNLSARENARKGPIYKVEIL